jgi:hypothetical protein
MSFESDIKKMQKLWDGSQDNQNAIARANDIQITKKQQIIELNTPPLTTKVLDEIGGAYKPISVFMTKPYQVNGFLWTVTKLLPEDWIPMIRTGVAYQYTGANTAFDKISTFYNVIVNVVPAPNGLVLATWSVGLYCVSYDPTYPIPDFLAKLYFTLIDPSTAS